jgi:hypothetical protein
MLETWILQNCRVRNAGNFLKAVSGDNHPCAGNSGLPGGSPRLKAKIMNPKLGLVWLSLGCLAVVSPVRAADTNAVAGRVGVYDSRAVAYAWFTSDAQMAQLKEQMAAGRAAQQAGDQAKVMEYKTLLKGKQDQIHREMFSTAPAAEALAVLDGKLQAIEQAAGVTNLVSKWDEPALRNYKDAEKVDVTDALVRAFIQPTEKQLKTIESIEKAAPLSLEKCNELIQKNEI